MTRADWHGDDFFYLEMEHVEVGVAKSKWNSVTKLSRRLG